MRKFFLLTGLVFLYLIYGVYLARYDVLIFPEDLVPEPPKGYLDYKGVTNVHTQMSSGSGDLPTVIQAGQDAGLDFLSITDLNVFDRPKSMAGYHGHMLVMIDGEYSYLNSRLLNIGATTSRHLQGVGRSQVLFADLLSTPDRESDLGIFVLAHPLKPRYRWTGDYPAGLDGMEVINMKNVWQEAWDQDRISFFASLVILPFNEKLALLRLFRSPDDVLRVWDTISQQRRILGLAGAEAEAKLIMGGNNRFFRFPSYATLFSLIRNHVLVKSELTGNAVSDTEKLTQALRQGQVYMSLDILGNPKGFNAVLLGEDGSNNPIGTRMNFAKGLSLEITLPQKPNVPFDTVIYRNGERVMTSNSKVTKYYINTPGVYRVMVRVIPTLPLPDGKKWIPWIYTNPFYIDEVSTRAASN
ncbi:MAG: hypothetical protein AB7F86_06430 [Bdellovibrionales bacterium]